MRRLEFSWRRFRIASPGGDLVESRQAEPEAGTAAFDRIEADRALVRFDDGTAGSEPQAGTFPLCREERSENLRLVLLVDSHAVVAHGGLDGIAVARDFDTDSIRRTGPTGGFERVLHQRDQHMLDSQAVDGDERQVLVATDLELAAGAGRKQFEHRSQFGHELAHRAWRTLRARMIEQAPNAADTLAGIQRLAVDELQDFQRRARHRLGPAQHALACLRERRD